MSKLQYTGVDRILSKFYREMKGAETNESDLIEWIGEALEFLKVRGMQEQAVAFIEVANYHAELPCGFQTVLQIARNNNWDEDNPNVTVDALVNEAAITSCDACGEGTPLDGDAKYPIPLDSNGVPIIDYDVAYYRPFFNLQWEYNPWVSSSMYTNNFTPVRLSNHNFFGSFVSREMDQTPYEYASDEYTIVGTQDLRLRFNFESGQIALSYLRSVTDSKTGYPLIPDNISYITAITYYLKWKLAEREDALHREGAGVRADKAERRWLKYARQGKNFLKMPKSIDDYQNLLEQTHSMIPNFKKYSQFFGRVPYTNYNSNRYE